MGFKGLHAGRVSDEMHVGRQPAIRGKQAVPFSCNVLSAWMCLVYMYVRYWIEIIRNPWGTCGGMESP